MSKARKSCRHEGLVGLAEGEWFAESGERGLEVGEGFGGEVVAEVGSEKRAVDLALLEAVKRSRACCSSGVGG